MGLVSIVQQHGKKMHRDISREDIMVAMAFRRFGIFVLGSIATQVDLLLAEYANCANMQEVVVA